MHPDMNTRVFMVKAPLGFLQLCLKYLFLSNVFPTVVELLNRALFDPQ